eukprot:15759-Chlamydomonas_euryale.AAC.4
MDKFAEFLELDLTNRVAANCGRTRTLDAVGWLDEARPATCMRASHRRHASADNHTPTYGVIHRMCRCCQTSMCEPTWLPPRPAVPSSLWGVLPTWSWV